MVKTESIDYVGAGDYFGVYSAGGRVFAAAGGGPTTRSIPRRTSAQTVGRLSNDNGGGSEGLLNEEMQVDVRQGGSSAICSRP